MKEACIRISYNENFCDNEKERTRFFGRNYDKYTWDFFRLPNYRYCIVIRDNAERDLFDFVSMVNKFVKNLTTSYKVHIYGIRIETVSGKALNE